MINLKYLIGIFSLSLTLTGCVNTPCWDVSVSGRLPEGGAGGSARGQVCLPPAQKDNQET